MKYVKMLGLAAVAAAALTAFVGAGTASATTLSGEGGGVLGSGTSFHAFNEGTLTWTTSFKNIECKQSTIAGKTTNETGTAIEINVETWTFGECNCAFSVIRRGKIYITWASGSNGAARSSGAELTMSCSTIFGTVHCIWATNSTELGPLTGGATAKLDIPSADIPRLPTSALCDESTNLDAIYSVDIPDTLNVKS